MVSSSGLKVIDISGYSFTGKSAAYDLLCEFEGYYSHSKEFEFDLIRIQGGLLDLQTALTGNWSPIRSTEIIRNFIRLVTLFGGDQSVYSRLTRTGAHYDYFFPGFSEITHRFVESLVIARWHCEWPFAWYGRDRSTVVAKKLLARIGLMKTHEVYLARMSEEAFIARARTYFNELFSSVSASSHKALILNNAFEPFYPERSSVLIENAKSIVVDRDPRDVYISALTVGNVAGSQVGIAVTGGSVENFIKRFRIYRTARGGVSPNVYRTHFEKILLDYEAEVRRIRGFLGESEGSYERQGTILRPVDSRRNISLWSRPEYSSLRRDIQAIQSELGEFCLDI